MKNIDKLSSMNQRVRWFILQNDNILLCKNTHTLPLECHITALSVAFVRQLTLGIEPYDNCYCAEISHDIMLPEDLYAVPLRTALSLLNAPDYRAIVRAYSILRWDRDHQFCGRCGKPTLHQSQGFERLCPSCNHAFYPRISPSIIVLIRKGEQLLMASSPHFLPGVYGLIAGFVDAGESLEEAVHREVKEEVGLTIKNLQYVASQPWPFPDSLMMGFTADHAGGDIMIDNHEIEAAGWYPYNKLPGRPSLPFSMASRLIDDFIRECENI